jgi:hypothetical protein
MALSTPPTRSSLAKTGKGKVEATTASATLVAANEERGEVVISNNGAKDVWLAFGPTAVAEEGVRLPTGSLPPFVCRSYSGQITVIAKEGTSVVSFAEV